MNTITEPKPVREENAIVLDHLENGYPFEQAAVKTPIVQALGVSHLTLLELIPKKGVTLQPMQKIYIGEGKREEIHHIKGRIPVEKLTATAGNTLMEAVEEIVTAQESRFVEFFNKAQPLSMRMHQLELLPGLGKKHMWEVLNARKEKPFESFDDIQDRVKLLPSPKQLIVKRIIAEIEGKEKYRIFSN
ncbi:DUF655 domain-containing protein [Candidatus Woesearchaeota archaeon]|nr:DUF655 domain-containing protein [Candidatus Woesearchaeota archaeon]